MKSIISNNAKIDYKSWLILNHKVRKKLTGLDGTCFGWNRFGEACVFARLWAGCWIIGDDEDLAGIFEVIVGFIGLPGSFIASGRETGDKGARNIPK